MDNDRSRETDREITRETIESCVEDIYTSRSIRIGGILGEAGKTVQRAAEEEPALVREVLDEIAPLLETDDYADVRTVLKYVAYAGGGSPDVVAEEIPTVAELLTHDVPEFRKSAVQTLQHIAHESGELYKHTLTGAGVKRKTLTPMWFAHPRHGVGDPPQELTCFEPAIQHLVSSLDDDESVIAELAGETLFFVACDSPSLLHDESIVTALRRTAADTDRPSKVRCHAVRTLGAIGTVYPESVDAFWSTLTDAYREPDYELQIAAIDAVGSIGRVDRDRFETIRPEFERLPAGTDPDAPAGGVDLESRGDSIEKPDDDSTAGSTDDPVEGQGPNDDPVMGQDDGPAVTPDDDVAGPETPDGPTGYDKEQFAREMIDALDGFLEKHRADRSDVRAAVGHVQYFLENDWDPDPLDLKPIEETDVDELWPEDLDEPDHDVDIDELLETDTEDLLSE